MAPSKCKICENQKDLVPLSGEYLGLSLLDIINNVTQSNVSTGDIGQSFMCNICAGTLFLVNTKVIEYKRVFLSEPSNSATSPVKKVQSAPKNLKSPKKKANHRPIVDVVNEEKSSQSKQVDGDITSFLKPIVKTKVTAKTKKSMEPLLSTENTSKLNVTDVKDSRNEIDSASIICCTDSEQDITEVKLSRPPGNIEPAPIRKRRNTLYNFDCEHCGFQSGLIKVFKSHLIEVHNVKVPRIFECTECNSRYVAKSSLDNHLKKCHKTNIAKEATNKHDKADEGSIKNNDPSTDSLVSTSEEVKSLGQNGLAESDDDKDSVIYESSPLSSTKLNQHKELTNDSKTNGQASKQNLTEDTTQYDMDATSMEFPIQVAKILPVVKKPLDLKEKSSEAKKNGLPFKKASSPKNKRSLSTKQDTPPTKKKKITDNLKASGDISLPEASSPTKKKKITDNLKATGDISLPEASSPMIDCSPTDVTSPKKKERSTSPQRKSPLNKSPSQSKKETSESKNDTQIFQFDCIHCSKMFQGPKAYKRHLLVEHNDEDSHIFACEFCPKKYLAYRSLKLHLDKNHTRTNPTENSKLQNDPILLAAIDDSLHSKKFFVNLSSKRKHDNSTLITTKTDEELENTINIDEFDTTEKRKQKTKINESHSQESGVDYKKEIETPKKLSSIIPADGSVKKKNLSVSFNIEDIKETSMTDLEIPCPHCLKYLKSTKKLNRHIIKCHSSVYEDIAEQNINEKRNVFHCEHCDKAFSGKQYLLLHMTRRHTPWM